MYKKENGSLIAIVAIVAIVAITILLLFAAKNRHHPAPVSTSACSSDADCGDGMRCINPGDPYAYCKFMDMGPEDVRKPVSKQVIITKDTYPPEMYK